MIRSARWPSYRQAFQERRCLIPVDGFYERRKCFQSPLKKFRENRETLKSTIPLYGSRRPAITNEKAEADRTKQTKHQEIVVQFYVIRFTGRRIQRRQHSDVDYRGARLG